MSSLDLADGSTLALDKDGFLADFNQWSPAAAQALAQLEGLALSEAHWQVIHLQRQFYATFELAPAMRPLVKFIAQQAGPELGNSLRLNQLFPGSPAKLSARLAGLPKPNNCL
ncbi:TusE/DsrC/DsvC family sulfur relay protein [Atopomonas sediminilitoris]|uniref:TusE/DsrC/DsvC family sulfur relay protein n=1 Tax=Atopomonas sediminilitoris TaxID=2919919 RepID=UPI001F4D3A36|nr:TusE/DsrC/DsvC family sulfur relay protein [Atopomonas sediminilitoris]MCJ8170796.1 TusE/DsrC/DsvC family sulfur relay protein [Atopomonas sediminilitoris]